MPQLKVENLYNTVITEAGGIPASGDCDFTVTTPPENTNGFIIISPENLVSREVMYYHNVIGNRIYVRGVNRFSPKAHASTEVVKINDVAEIFNTFSDMIAQTFYIEKTGGFNIKVWGGYVYYNGVAVSVADTNLTLVNGTNYIKYSYPTNTVSSDLVNSGNIKAEVVVTAGIITSITYRNAKESYIDFTVAITGALPDQTGNAGKVLFTNGTTVYWGDVVIPNASTTVAGKVEIATFTEAQVGTDTGGTGATNVIIPSVLKNLYYFGNGADGDVTISSNTTLTRDMYYNNLTINSTFTLDPNGFAIYIRGSLLGAGKIARNGNNGANASGRPAGNGGAALNTGTCGPNLAGGNGGIGSINNTPGAGVAGVSVNPSYAPTSTNAAAGGSGGLSGGTFAPGTGGGAGTATRGALHNVSYELSTVMTMLMNPQRAIALASTVYGGLPSAGGGGGGGAANSETGGGGGGAGGNGGIIFLYVRNIDPSSTVTIEARGGNGGSGGNGTLGGGGGGGGGGGSGGVVFLVYDTGTVPTITLTGGTAGAGGLGSSPGVNGASGGTGTTGTSIITQV